MPQTLLFIPLGGLHTPDYRLGDTASYLILSLYCDLSYSVLHLAHDGLRQGDARGLEECARIDGASRWQAMLYIVA